MGPHGGRLAGSGVVCGVPSLEPTLGWTRKRHQHQSSGRVCKTPLQGGSGQAYGARASLNEHLC